MYKGAVIVACASVLVACAAVPGRPALLDLDNDKVIDSEDACPGTAVGTPVSADGCSVFSRSLDAVEFGPGDHRLNAASRTALTEFVELLTVHPDVTVQLGGHTDNRGSAAENLELSKRRVMSVVKFLVSNGIVADRLKPFGFGESRPIMSNATDEGRAMNRRIEVTVIEQ